MVLSRSLWLLCGLVACAGDKDPESDDSGSIDDSSVQGSEDTADSGGDSSDTGDASPSDSMMTVSVDGGTDGLLVGVVQVKMSSEGMSAGEIFSSGVIIDGAAEITLPAPSDSDLDDPETGALVGSYAIFVRKDANEDGLHDEGEAIIGVAETRLLFIGGELDTDSEALGLELGWNALWFDMGGPSEPVLYELDSVTAELNLIPAESIEFGGSSDVSDTPADPIRMTVKPLEVKMSEAVISSLLLDTQMTPSWSVEVDGPPDASHMVVSEGVLLSARERFLVYVDIDESESLSSGDEPLYGVCSEGSPAVLIWIDPIGSVADAITAPVAGIQIGWSLWAFDSAGIEPPRVLGETERLELVAESSCSLE
jgi:hypothetical protein